MRSTVQNWVGELTLMQQAVLLSSIRGPDGIHKDHVSKKLIRWLRRCILVSAFEGGVYNLPYDPIGSNWRGGSFTGPSIEQDKNFINYYRVDHDPEQMVAGPWQEAMAEVSREYMRHLDETPHHFQLHFMHAAEILGYKHPEDEIRSWWLWLYNSLTNDMHLNPETEEQLDYRLADVEGQWREKEEVTAK